MDIIKALTEEFGLKQWQVEHTIELIDDGNTIPFIARYRKEATCSLDDQLLRELSDRLAYLRNLDETREKIRAAIVGYGNIGKFVLDALETAPDFEVAGIVRRSISNVPAELSGYNVVTNINQLEDVNVAILCTPTREVEKYATEYLAKGINTVDSFDIHTGIAELRRNLNTVAQANGTVAIISAGWDPGSDSVVRTLLQAAAPKGLTYTNFGPGMSMGHTVCVKSKDGVKNALSMTIPLGTGIHRRMVYVELEDGYTLEQVTKAVKSTFPIKRNMRITPFF